MNVFGHGIRKRYVKVSKFPLGKRFGRYSQILNRTYNSDGSPAGMTVIYDRDSALWRNVLSKIPDVPKSVKTYHSAQYRMYVATATDIAPVIQFMDKVSADWYRYEKR